MLYMIEDVDPTSPGDPRDHHILLFDPEPLCLRVCARGPVFWDVPKMS